MWMPLPVNEMFTPLFLTVWSLVLTMMPGRLMSTVFEFLASGAEGAASGFSGRSGCSGFSTLGAVGGAGAGGGVGVLTLWCRADSTMVS